MKDRRVLAWHRSFFWVVWPLLPLARTLRRPQAVSKLTPEPTRSRTASVIRRSRLRKGFEPVSATKSATVLLLLPCACALALAPYSGAAHLQSCVHQN